VEGLQSLPTILRQRSGSDFWTWEERYASPRRRPRRGPSAWLVTYADRLPTGRALDVATGEGRNALFLARRGFEVTGVDRSPTALRTARARAREEGLELELHLADLEACKLPAGPFDVVVVMRYLQRSLFEPLGRALAPGGVLLYESFTRDYLKYGPRNPEHLLRPGELREAFRDLEILAYRETEDPERREARASLLARRPLGP
jgi:SAM-dependent methyltransferase